MRKAFPWRQPTFYCAERGQESIAYIRCEVVLTESQWMDLQDIAAHDYHGQNPRSLLAGVALDRLRAKIVETFGE